LLLWWHAVEAVLLHSRELLLTVLLHISHWRAHLGWGTSIVLGRRAHVARRSHVVARGRRTHDILGWWSVVILGRVAHVWVVHAIWLLLRKVISVV